MKAKYTLASGTSFIYLHASYRDPIQNMREYKGVITSKEGAYYIGYLSRGRPHGKGRQINPDLSVYEGDFVTGIQDGIGALTQADGNKIFEGPFIQGKMEGKFLITVPGKPPVTVEMKNNEPVADNPANDNPLGEAFI